MSRHVKQTCAACRDCWLCGTLTLSDRDAKTVLLQVSRSNAKQVRELRLAHSLRKL
jgi:hypothetical protein